MTDRLRILFTIPNFLTAGSGGAMMNIIERLDQDRFEPAVCVSRPGGALENRVRELGLTLILSNFTVPAKPYLQLLPQARECAGHFKPYHFDLWHSFHYLDDYSEPIIARLSGAKAWIFTKKNMNWGRNAWYMRSLLASGIVAQNSDMMRHFYNRWPYRNKVRLIPRGVDISKFKPGNAHQNELRRRTGLDNDQILVGIVANLVPVKGHPTLIEAVAGLDNVHLFIAGRIDDPAYRVQLGDQAQDLHIANRIHFLGHIDDVPGFLHQMDIITLPTWDRWRREGCPVALLEAMACGKPCIATDIPGARDIIRDGINGLLIPPEDAGALSEALRRLSTHADVRKQLGKSARRTIVERYSIEKEVNAHEKFYTAILNH